MGNMVKRTSRARWSVSLFMLLALCAMLVLACGPLGNVAWADEPASSASVSAAEPGASSEAAADVASEEIEDEDVPLAELEARRTASAVGGSIQSIVVLGIVVAIAGFAWLTLRENRGIAAMRRRMR